MHLRVACSPDADDLFMVRGLVEGLVDPGGFTWSITPLETDALNRMASGQGPEVSAISVAHYPRIAAAWQLLPHGGSVGDGYGPLLVAREPLTLAELRGARVAVPGLTTTAWCVLSLALEALTPVVTPITPYHRIFEALARREVDAGLVIHEGRLTYAEHGLHAVADLGVWWKGRTGLPLPLGANAIRRDLGPDVIRRASAVLRESIRLSLVDQREEAISWLLSRGGALRTREAVSQYLDMYANQETLGWSAASLAGMAELFRQGEAAGLLPGAPVVDLAP